MNTIQIRFVNGGEDGFPNIKEAMLQSVDPLSWYRPLRCRLYYNDLE